MWVPVCVLTFKGTSCGTLCPPLQHLPDLLGPCDKQAELWSTLEAAVVATSNSLSSKCKFEWSKKAQETWQFLSPSPTPDPLFISLALCACQFVEGAHCILYTVFLCVAVACCTMLPFSTSDGLCLHLSLHKMDNEDDVYWISSTHSSYLVLPTLFWLCLPLFLRTWNANQW